MLHLLMKVTANKSLHLTRQHAVSQRTRKNLKARFVTGFFCACRFSKFHEIPSRLKINKIQDEDIRFKTYFLNEVAEQAERIKATAVFCEEIKPNDDNKQAGFILYLWERQSILTQLAAARKKCIDIFASKELA